MSENTGSKQKRALPFEVSKGFAAVPVAVLTHYSYYPKFNGNHVRLYAFLVQNYNEAFGYAYPTQVQIAQALNITDKTVRSLIALLEEVELIEAQENRPHDNHVYYFIPPIEDEDAFFAKFPQAAEIKRKKDEFWAKELPEKQARKERKGVVIADDMAQRDGNQADELAELNDFW